MVRPMRMRSVIARNSVPTGSGSSLETMPRLSEIGRPDLRPRTSRSIASGKMAVNLEMRFWINIETALCGSAIRSEEHTSELQSLMRISYAVFCLKKKHEDYH